MSRQRYWIRRIGVLAVLGLVGYAGVTAATGLFGDDGDGSDDSAAPTETGGDLGGSGGSDPGGAGAVGESALADAPSDAGQPEALTSAEGEGIVDAPDDSTTVPSTTTPGDGAADGPPSPENPAMVYIVGDSDAGTFGPYLEELLAGTLITETELNYKVSSGLARPDFYNWPAELESTLPAVDPDIVVVTFGGNDAQGLATPAGDFILGTPSAENEEAWVEEYQARAGEVMDLLLENDRQVIWVGIPNDDNPDVTERLAVQDRAARAAAAERPGVVFVDTWARFSGRDGGWAEFVVDPRDGVGKDVRADDGFHLNVNGAEILAIDIAVEVRDALRELGANI